MPAEKTKKKSGNPNFYKGMPSLNPVGRPIGSVNKYTALSREVLSAKGPEIVDKVIEMALAGDRHCLKMCMDRIVPTTKAVEISHRKHDGGIIINVSTTEEIKKQAAITKPKQLRSKSEDAVVSEVIEEITG